MSEAQINEQITEMFNGTENVLNRRTRQLIRTIGASRLTISDLISKYADEESGKVPQSKLPQLLREVDELEAGLYRNIRDDLREAVKGIAEQSATSLSEIIVGTIGYTALESFIGLGTINTLSEQALFSILIGLGIAEFVTSIVTSTFNRKGDDGLDLNDRLRNLAQLLAHDLRNILRETIGRGEGTAEIMRKINRVIEDNDWRVATIVETESMFALRQSIGKFAETSGMVKALKIVDFPHGEPGEHERHLCHIYAHRNEHGMGEGVYPVGTRKIRNPHPQCRSILQFVMIDEFK